MAAQAFNQLSLAPLGAGDLIDRAVRLYRRHFMTLIRIASPPVVISTIGSMLWTIGQRGLFLTARDERLALYVMLMVLGVLLSLGGILFNLIVMGGAARNLVTHLLWNEPVTARATYRNVRARFWGLVGAAIIIFVFVFLTGIVAFIAWMIAYFVLALGVFAMVQIAGWLAALVGVIGFLTISLMSLAIFFFLAGRVAYVPQVMLIEGKSIGQALTRSFSLARGNVRRLLAMFLFTSFTAYSALMILLIPLGWYGYVNGIDPSPWSAVNWPTWYAIGYSVLWQVSQILLLPVWMLGLSLLYVDERVRHEGYDIELLAARQLGAMPSQWGASPAATHYTPAIAAHPYLPTATSTATTTARPQDLRPPGSMLGLR